MPVRRLRSGRFPDPKAVTRGRERSWGTIRPDPAVSTQPPSGGGGSGGGGTPTPTPTSPTRTATGGRILIAAGATRQQVALFRDLSWKRRQLILQQTGRDPTRLLRRVRRIQRRRQARRA